MAALDAPDPRRDSVGRCVLNSGREHQAGDRAASPKGEIDPCALAGSVTYPVDPPGVRGEG